MMLKIISITVLPAVILLIFGCTQSGTDKVTVATAANMQFVMKELTRSFTEQTGIRCEAIISSSGKLTAHIKKGAPYDIFVSADMKYPVELYESGFTTRGPEIYAHGKLVLWTIADDIKPGIEILTDPKINHIALANPRLAPYGAAAVEVLKYFGIYEQVVKKLVFGESISQVNHFITSGSAEIGITSKSVVFSSEMKGKGNWADLEKNSYMPISQAAVILKREKDMTDAVRFYDFLFSEDAKEIFRNFGYEVIEK